MDIMVLQYYYILACILSLLTGANIDEMVAGFKMALENRMVLGKELRGINKLRDPTAKLEEIRLPGTRAEKNLNRFIVLLKDSSHIQVKRTLIVTTSSEDKLGQLRDAFQQFVNHNIEPSDAHALTLSSIGIFMLSASMQQLESWEGAIKKNDQARMAKVIESAMATEEKYVKHFDQLLANMSYDFNQKLHSRASKKVTTTTTYTSVGQPSDKPIPQPSDKPISQPSDKPISQPSDKPTSQPSITPTLQQDSPQQPPPMVWKKMQAQGSLQARLLIQLLKIRERGPLSDRKKGQSNQIKHLQQELLQIVSDERMSDIELIVQAIQNEISRQ